MKIAFFDTHRYDREAFLPYLSEAHWEWLYLEIRLDEKTAALAKNCEVVCAFVNDRLDAAVLEMLHSGGTRLIALRSAGFNHVDLKAAKRLGVSVVRVPEYSPNAVAEHALMLMLALSRKIHRAHNRVREGNFSLEGLVGFNLFQKTVGVLGTGKIGSVLAKSLLGLGCRVLAYDQKPNSELQQFGVRYLSLDEIFRQSQIISLHLPLNRETHHLVNESKINLSAPGLMLINTGRGGLIDSHAMIQALKSGQIGYAGLDVYEEEEGIFFNDLSETVLQDDQLARLLTFPNVLLTSHQAFLTHEALAAIAKTTVQSIREFQSHLAITNQVALPD